VGLGTVQLRLDISFNTFTLDSFSDSPEETRLISASFGYSLLIPEKKE
jgi:hypothetical protein